MDTTFLQEISLLVRSPKKGIDEIFWFGTLEKGIKAGLAGWCATHILGFALGIILLPLAMTFWRFFIWLYTCRIWHILYITRNHRSWNLLVCR